VSLFWPANLAPSPTDSDAPRREADSDLLPGARPDALLDWFDRARRDLPWRRTGDPYRIWLSEVMLQQTRVEVVLPYYERFLAKFPDVEALAAAEIPDVLARWSGLGYYRRARQLHAAACRIAERGGFPRTLEGLLELPGIGPYTAAAVASIAFGVVTPVLDGNVERVVSRLLALPGDLRTRPARARLLAAAGALLDPGRPGDSNQALMELGATVCSPRAPKCLLCPLLPGCRAGSAGAGEAYPTPRPKRAPRRHRLAVAVVEDEAGGGVLLLRRPDDSPLLAGTWELPWVEVRDLEGEEGGGEPDAALAARYGGHWRLAPSQAQVRHGITFRDLTVAVHRAELAPESRAALLRDGAAAGFFDAPGRAALPLSSLVGKVLRALGIEQKG
jgi:A/G-specific adenine glycosylase